MGFLEKAVGSIFIIAGVRASNIPNKSLSVTLNRKMEAPGLMQEAAAFICAGNPNIPLPKHSSIVSLLQPKIKPVGYEKRKW